MTTETMPASGVAAEQVTPAENAIENPEVATPEADTQDQTQTAEATADESDKSLKRMERRIGRLTADKYTAQAEVRQLRDQLSRLEQSQASTQETQQVKPEDIDRIASERAQELRRHEDTTKRSNEAFKEGVKAFGEAFKESVSVVIEEAGALINERGLPTALGEAVLDADKPAQLLHYLGQNPDIAAELEGLSPARLGRRIAQIEAQMKPAEPQRSKAPAPLQAVKGSGKSTDPAPGSPEYIPWKLKQLRGG